VLVILRTLFSIGFDDFKELIKVFFFITALNYVSVDKSTDRYENLIKILLSYLKGRDLFVGDSLPRHYLEETRLLKNYTFKLEGLILSYCKLNA
jgi:hypothetical protein